MNEDWLRHWRTWAMAWETSATPWPPASSPMAGAPGADRSDPYAAIAAAFTAAARAAIDGAARAPAQARAPAIEQFAEFLRAQFSDWSALSALGPQRLHQERAERMSTAASEAQGAQARLSRLWSDTLRQAAGVFANRCADPGAAAAPPIELYDAWIDCAEDAYGRMAHGEAFCSAQADLLNAQSKLRAEMRAILELWCKELDLPTRSELNSVHMAMKELREQLPKTLPDTRGKQRATPTKHEISGAGDSSPRQPKRRRAASPRGQNGPA